MNGGNYRLEQSGIDPRWRIPPRGNGHGEGPKRCINCGRVKKSRQGSYCNRPSCIAVRKTRLIRLNYEFVTMRREGRI